MHSTKPGTILLLSQPASTKPPRKDPFGVNLNPSQLWFQLVIWLFVAETPDADCHQLFNCSSSGRHPLLGSQAAVGRPRYYRFVTVIYGMTRNPVIARPALQSAALSWETTHHLTTHRLWEL